MAAERIEYLRIAETTKGRTATAAGSATVAPVRSPNSGIATSRCAQSHEAAAGCRVFFAAFLQWSETACCFSAPAQPCALPAQTSCAASVDAQKSDTKMTEKIFLTGRIILNATRSGENKSKVLSSARLRAGSENCPRRCALFRQRSPACVRPSRESHCSHSCGSRLQTHRVHLCRRGISLPQSP